MKIRKIILTSLFFACCFSANLFGMKNSMYDEYGNSIFYNRDGENHYLFYPYSQENQQESLHQFISKPPIFPNSSDQVVYRKPLPSQEIEKKKQQNINAYHSEIVEKYNSGMNSKVLLKEYFEDYKRYKEPNYIDFIRMLPGGNEKIVELSERINSDKCCQHELDYIFGVERADDLYINTPKISVKIPLINKKIKINPKHIGIGSKYDKRPIIDSINDAANLSRQAIEKRKIEEKQQLELEKEQEKLLQERLKQKNLEDAKNAAIKKAEKEAAIEKFKEIEKQKAAEDAARKAAKDAADMAQALRDKKIRNNFEQWKEQDKEIDRLRKLANENPRPFYNQIDPTQRVRDKIGRPYNSDNGSGGGDGNSGSGPGGGVAGDNDPRGGVVGDNGSGDGESQADCSGPPAGKDDGIISDLPFVYKDKVETNKQPTPQTKTQKFVKNVAVDLAIDFVGKAIKHFASGNSSHFYDGSQQSRFSVSQNFYSSSYDQSFNSSAKELSQQSYPYNISNDEFPVDPRIVETDNEVVSNALLPDQFDYTSTTQSDSINSQQSFPPQFKGNVIQELPSTPSYYETKKQIEVFGQNVCNFEDQVISNKNLFGPVSGQVEEYSKKITNTSFDFLELANEQQNQDHPQLKYALTELGGIILQTGQLGTELAKDSRLQTAFLDGSLDNILTVVGSENDLWEKFELGDQIYSGAIKGGSNFVNKWIEAGTNPKETFQRIGEHFVAMKDLAIKSVRLGAEASTIIDLRRNGLHAEADRLERIVEEKIKKINNAVDKFYNGLSQMSPEETVELFTNVLTFPFTPEGLVYRGVGKASRSAFRTTTRTAPTTTTRTVPMTTTRTVPKKSIGQTSNQPLRRSPRIAEKRKFAGAEQVGSGGKKFAGETGTGNLSDLYKKVSYSSQHSKGARWKPKNLKEQIAMKEVLYNPLGGRELKKVQMTDSKWHMREGWVKMKKNVNNVEIHYVWNKILNVFDDFKFK